MSSRLRLLSGTALAAFASLAILAGAPAQQATAQEPLDATLEAAGEPAGTTSDTPVHTLEAVDSSGAGMGTSDPAPVAAVPPTDPTATDLTPTGAIPEPSPAASAEGPAESPAAAEQAALPEPAAPADTAARPSVATPTAVAPAESPSVPASEPPAAATVATPDSATPVETSPAAPAPVAETPAPVSPAPASPAAEAPAPVPAVAEAPAQHNVAMQVSALLEGEPLDSLGGTKAEREAIVAFYTARGGEPLFTAGHELSPLGRTVTKVFAAAANEGLSPADYAVTPPKPEANDADVAETELRLAAATLAYARHLQSGRFQPGRISAFVDPSPTVPEPAAVLADVTGAPDARTVLAGFAPQYPGYVALKAKLAELRPEEGAVAPPQVPDGKLLRPGMKDPRVPVLRIRLGLPASDDQTYDPDLAQALKDFQAKAGQKPDGLLGRSTLAALNDTGERRIADIVANMERWRWVPHEVAPDYVIVNIPEFMVRIVKDGEPFHETRVVVGTPQNQTPLLSHEMEYLVFNPSWNVPPGISRKEMLPRLAADPYHLARQGIDVVRNGRVIDPGMVDWSRGMQGYSFRQPPGERNALGRIKFMFPNKHSVYLHDTPSRALFARERRAYSHGCVRVHEPLKFAEAIFDLGMPEPWSQKRIASQLGGRERYVNLKQRFPVHLVYFTSFVNEDGQLVSREDIYGVNAQTKLQLGLDGARRVADRRTNPAR